MITKLSVCYLIAELVVYYFITMSYSSRLQTLTRSMGLMTRRVWPVAIGGFGAYVLLQTEASCSFIKKASILTREFVTCMGNETAKGGLLMARAESEYKCQDIVIREDKAHGLFLILHLHPHASAKDCVQALRKIQAHVDRISPKDIRDEDNELIVGLAFGQEFLAKIYPDADKNGVEPFPFSERKGKVAQMPSTGGDILVHAVCGEQGKLFELAQAVLDDMPKGAVQSTEETYGFTYRDGRDLSGFVDGTANPADETDRIEAAVSETTGGSYVLTQRWLHDMKKIASENVKTMEANVGRTKTDNIRIEPIAPTSHLGRVKRDAADTSGMTGRMVRHSLPYGIASGECGLFFVAYTKSPQIFDWALDRMAGLSHDRIEDGLFHFTRPLTGAYFYSPSRVELETILKGGGKRFSLLSFLVVCLGCFETTEMMFYVFSALWLPC
ncbi:putative deferrochelatase/peroxidase YfeX [Echinococcus granulosus]|uniref:Iron dependent peroxidase n=1 Tax=Echinococcus granulosus TaxID=6210 RepID=A0A068WQ63_ECHGR|nr:putative deferrochelatase/peroxidase YfeX [Echinococcus granulosus]CDS20655.1 iron dependent peroxidase [Echinococcus granulosus]